MKLAAIQMDVQWEAPEVNLRRTALRVAEATQAGAEVVVLPEMFSTGFTMDAVKAAESGESTLLALQEMARENGVALIAGIVEAALNDAARPRNLCVVLDANGCEMGRYRKIHPFTLAGEQKSYDAGTELLTLSMTQGIRVTPLICYDLRFPEVFRARALETDLFCVIASWPSKRIAAWRALLIARAIENQCYVLGVNRVGMVHGVEHCGGSLLVAPDGGVLCEASASEECLMTSIDADVVASHRRAFTFLCDRRPDVYRNFAEPKND